MTRSISSAVGANALNLRDDVRTVQTLLNAVAVDSGGASPRLTVDGFYGAATGGAISRFQLRQFGTADGLVSPGQRTIARLNQLAPASGPSAAADAAILQASKQVIAWGQQCLRYPSLSHSREGYALAHQLRVLDDALVSYVGIRGVPGPSNPPPAQVPGGPPPSRVRSGAVATGFGPSEVVLTEGLGLAAGLAFFVVTIVVIGAWKGHAMDQIREKLEARQLIEEELARTAALALLASKIAAEKFRVAAKAAETALEQCKENNPNTAACLLIHGVEYAAALKDMMQLTYQIITGSPAASSTQPGPFKAKVEVARVRHVAALEALKLCLKCKF